MFCMPELNGQISPAGPRQTCQIYTPTNNMHSRQQYLFSWSVKNYEMAGLDITEMSNISSGQQYIWHMYSSFPFTMIMVKRHY